MSSASPFVVKLPGGHKTHRAIPTSTQGLNKTLCGAFTSQGPEPEGVPVSCKKCRERKRW